MFTDRAFIVGEVLPTLLFAGVGHFLFRDLGPVDASIASLMAKDVGQVVYLLITVWVIAGAVFILNHTIYRFLEGYAFPEPVAKLLKARNIKRLMRARHEVETLYYKWAEQGSAFSVSDFNRYRTLRLKLVVGMPSSEDDVLPTRFGNAIRAFEVYPRDVYGVDGVVMWFRLAAVMPKEFVDQIQDQRSYVDFFVNCSLFSAIIGLLALGRALFFQGHDNDTFAAGAEHWGWLLGGVLATYLFYRLAIAHIPAWGALVMSAFDCYLPALAAQLGFELPHSESMRRAFWTSFSQQLIYRREPDGQLPFQLEEWKRASSKTDDDEEGCTNKSERFEGRPSAPEVETDHPGSR